MRAERRRAPRAPAPRVLDAQALLALWEDLLRSRATVRIVGQGYSMWPAVPPGSVLELRPCAAEELSPGELVTVRVQGRVISHRLVRRLDQGTLLLWGDARMQPDPPIPPEDVLGRALLVKPGRLRDSQMPWSLPLRRVAAGLRRRWVGGAW